MKIKYCLKIHSYDYFNGDYVREHYYTDISELNRILSTIIFPNANFVYIKKMEIVKL